MTIKHLYIIFIFLFSSNSFSTNYYFSNLGSDSNTGTNLNDPFKTIEKLATLNLQPGDSILLKKGEIFIGQINIKSSGTVQQNISISSYGIGTTLPILTGATSLKSWIVYPQNNNLYTSTILVPVKQLYSNNTLLDLARYPNAPNYLYANSGMTVGNVQQFSPTTLTQATGYWVGATVKYRANNWAWEYRPITAFANGNISHKPDTRYAVGASNTFFIENKKEQLDAKNEWFYDDTNRQILYYPSNSATIQTANIKAVMFDNAVKLDSLVSYISISNIVFDKYAGNGIYGVARNAFIKIENCAFQNIEEIGVKFYRKANNCIVNNCFLRDVRGRGISFVEGYKNTISNNSLKRIGMIPGRGISGVNGYVGIVCEIRDESRDRVLDQYDSVSNNNNIHHNTIDSTGYIGIRADGQYNTVEKNIINHAMLHMDDGGGLYCFNGVTKGGYFKNNFIYDCSLQANMTQGIYVDNKVYDLNVINNTVVNTPGSGIEINAEAHDNNIRGNVLFNNSLGVIFPDWGTTAIYGNKMYQNTIVSNASNKLAVQIMSNTNRYNVVTADSNYYVNPYTENIFQYSWSQSATFNLATWRTKVPYNDLHAIALTNKSTPKATAGTFFLFTNKTDNPRTVDLTGCGCTDLKSAAVNQLVLQAFSSQVLIKDPTKCTGIVNDAPFLMATYAWPAKSYDNLVLAPDSYFGIVSSSKQVDKNNQIAIYPNQLYVGELVHINGIESDVDKIMISVSNLAGKKVFETSLTSKYEFYVPTIAAGVYLLSINAAGFNNTVKLLVK